MTTDKNQKNCSQIRETILIVNVAVARIEHAMLEGNDSFTSLSQSFIETINSTHSIADTVNELDDSPIKTKIKSHCDAISRQVDHSIISFQFYDKLSQRMGLVSKTLALLNEVLNDETKMNNKDEWKNLQQMIRSKYTLDADQEMFDAVLQGAPIEEALKIAVEKTTENDVEFF